MSNVSKRKEVLHLKIGIVADIAKSQVVHEAGFDFMESAVATLIPEENDHAFREKLKRFQESPVPVEAFNCFIPGIYKVVGDSVDYDHLHRYVEKVMERVKAVKASIIVFGSGGARKIPEGFSREKAEEQMIKFLHLVADYAEPLGITIAIEPLFKQSSNFINRIPEAVEYVNKVNRKSIRALADFFHMMEEEEPLEHIVAYRNCIHHIHVSDSYKPPGNGDYPFPRFVECVRQANYTNRISIECVWDDLDKQILPVKAFIFEQFHELRKSNEGS